MKKIIVVLGILIVLFVSSMDTEKVVIPKEAIRFRVIANSNSNIDQMNKKLVARNLSEDVSKVLSESNNINDARRLLQTNIDSFKVNIDNTLKENNINDSYTINYGENYFPEKEYKGVVYKEGEYESLVVTMGEGKGENFWCVLFPPLCLLDAEEDNTNDVKYTSFVKELLDKYF